MAHTNHSNGAYEEFEDLAGSQYWKLALKEFPGLKVSFGHFGDTDLELRDENPASETRKFLKLMTQTAGSDGTNAFADSGYFAGALMNQTTMTAALKSLYAASENRTLRERLMYGTDWTMILPQKHVERYLSDFIQIINKVENDQPGTVRGTSLANAFFGSNAAEYLGLKSGSANRKRLEAFYLVNKVATPDWMRKVDNL